MGGAVNNRATRSSLDATIDTEISVETGSLLVHSEALKLKRSLQGLIEIKEYKDDIMEG